MQNLKKNRWSWNRY